MNSPKSRVVTFASDSKSDRTIKDHAMRNISELACFRDFILETSLRFMMPAATPDEGTIVLTPRELECLKWSAFGKSSWDIANIMNCSESGINAHFNRIRRKFGTSTRRQAIVKAIRMGIIAPA